MRKIISKLYLLKIFKRLIPSLIKIYTFFISRKIKISHKNFFILLNLKNPIDREIYLKDTYEPKQLEFLKNIIQKENIKYFFDIGAHMGYYSLNLAIDKNMNIHSVEPFIENFQQLESNKKINNFENIKTYNLALSNKKQEIKMWVSDKKKTGGFAVLNLNDEELKKYNKLENYEVNAISEMGDKLFLIKNKKIAIKIDVERHEKEVIEGAKSFLTNNKSIMQIEVFNERNKEINEILEKIYFKKFYNIGKDYFYKNY